VWRQANVYKGLPTPFFVKNARSIDGLRPLRNRWFADSSLEGTVFELPVPRRGKRFKPQYHSLFAGRERMLHPAPLSRGEVCMEPKAASYTGLIGGISSLLSRQAGRASRWRLLEAR